LIDLPPLFGGHQLLQLGLQVILDGLECGFLVAGQVQVLDQRRREDLPQFKPLRRQPSAWARGAIAASSSWKKQKHKAQTIASWAISSGHRIKAEKRRDGLS